MEIGVYDAMSHFNIGNKAAILVYDKLGMVAGNNVRKVALWTIRFVLKIQDVKAVRTRKTDADILGVSKSRKTIKSQLLKERHMVLVLFDVFILK